ncbi:hypothetical protein GF386_02700 [Candidatus Pacearchaeota archaeon]|nr:hypothetical protein [Candidatus Pacearchaeota archaeon]MBD3283058.1 hypothetical protein [Candidatus Pacearchaeota archaeon]
MKKRHVNRENLKLGVAGLLFVILLMSFIYAVFSGNSRSITGRIVDVPSCTIPATVMDPCGVMNNWKAKCVVDDAHPYGHCVPVDSDEQVCISKTCFELGKECGFWDDGCGTEINCGNCPEGEICSHGNCVKSITSEKNSYGVYDGMPCNPYEASVLGMCYPGTCYCPSNIYNCYCSGTGNSNASDCIPKTCFELGKECGFWDDGCGTEINCGFCGYGQTCNSRGRCIDKSITGDSVECNKDSDCGLNYVKNISFCSGIQFCNKSEVSYTCENPGTSESKCASHEVFSCTICENGCENQSCIKLEDEISEVFPQNTPRCYNDLDCGSENLTTSCLGKSLCTHVTNPVCKNPRTSDSYCISDIKITCNVCENGCENKACIEGTVESDIQESYEDEEEGVISEIEESDSGIEHPKIQTKLCMSDGFYYSIGSVKNGEYCSDSGRFKEQLELNSNCEHNYECKSNLCKDSRCKEESLISQIFGWIGNLFK